MKWFKTKKDVKPLRAKSIGFSYGTKPILKNLNLSINNNQILAIVGQSGEGKSTFLHLVAGVMTKGYQGKIRIKGLNRTLSKRDIGFVPQEVSLIPDLSIEDNLVFFGNLNNLSSKKSLNQGKALMKLLQLDISLDRFPTELSGGQRVRLNIVVSILHKPNVLILDEPFVGLDYQNRKILWHFLKYLKNRRHTIILTTHMLVEAEHHCDKIVLLKNGKVFASGKLEDLREKLKARFIFEVKIKQLSKTNLEAIKKYCIQHDIAIIDQFDNFFMFAVLTFGARNYFLRFLEKLNTGYEEISFREPNLDELFLKVKQQ